MDNTEDVNMLTLGQATCLVLGLPPSDENRKKAKELMAKEPLFEVTFDFWSSPLQPYIIGKKLKTMNPFVYQSYPSTPPSESSTMAPAGTCGGDNDAGEGISTMTAPHNDDDYDSPINYDDNYFYNYQPAEDEEGHSSNSSHEKEGNDTKKNTDANFIHGPDSSTPPKAANEEERELVMNFVKKVFTVEKPDQPEKYSFMWVSTMTQLEIVFSHLKTESLSAQDLEGWICQEELLGKKALKHIKDYGPQYGRYLYVLNQNYRDKRWWHDDRNDDSDTVPQDTV